MKRLKNLSLFKLIILTLIASYINNLFLFIIVGIYFLVSNKKYLYLYISLLLMLFIVNKYCVDLLPIGIVDYKYDNYYIVDKIIYKVKLITDDELNSGDVLYFSDTFNTNKYVTELRKNIKYYGYGYKKLFTFPIRNYIYQSLSNYSETSKNLLLKLLYNINSNDDLVYSISYGLAYYYLFKYIYKQNKQLSIVFIIIYSLIFNFQVKLLLIFIDYLLSFIDIDDINKYAIKIFIIFLINNNLFFNYSIIIPLLIGLYNYIDLKLAFNNYFALIQSILFGEISILSSLFYRYYIIIQIFIFMFSLVLLIVPDLENIYLSIINVLAYINTNKLSIRGSISFISLFIIIYLIKTFKIKNQLIIYVLSILVIISPFNNPFGKVSFIDVGQGDASLIKLGMNRGNILIDTGSKYNYYKLKKYLYSQGIYSIDYLIITHDDSDHNGNLNSLINDFNVINIIDEGIDINYKDIYLKYYDLGTFENDNDNSLVYATSINGIDYLFTGDISSNVEKLFINKYGPIHFDVLKVSHHGSNTASSKYFIGNILPSYAIISTSGAYNHPSARTIDNLNAYLVKYFNTKYDKNIEFYYLFGLNILKYGIANFVIIR